MEKITDAFRITYENGISSINMVFEPKTAFKFVNYQYEMLSNNACKGIMATSSRQKDKQVYLYCDITSRLSLAQYLKGRRISKADFLGIISSIVETIFSSRGYLLHECCFALDKDYIYIKPGTCDVQLAYLPFNLPYKADTALKKLLIDLIMTSDFDEENEDNFLQRVLSNVKSETFCLNELRKLLKDISYTRSQDIIDFDFQDYSEVDLTDEDEKIPEKNKVISIGWGFFSLVLSQVIMCFLLFSFVKSDFLKDILTKYSVCFVIAALDILAIMKFFCKLPKLKREQISMKKEQYGDDRDAIEEKRLIEQSIPTGEKNTTGERSSAKERSSSVERRSTEERYLRGERSPSGERISAGERFSAGERSSAGERGSTEERCLRGERSLNGERSLTGERGSRGERSSTEESCLREERSSSGERGSAGERSSRGERKLSEERSPNYEKSKKADNSLCEEKSFPVDKNLKLVSDIRGHFDIRKAQDKMAPEEELKKKFNKIAILEDATTLLSVNDMSQKESELPYACLKRSINGVLEEIHISKKYFTLGRLEGQVDHVCKSNAVGRVHAEISYKDGAYYVKDLNSRNGTFINNERIDSNKEYLVSNKDRISFANFEYSLVIS